MLWRERTAVLLLLPALAVIVVFRLVPLVVAAYMSLTNWSLTMNASFVGLAHYKKLLLSDRLFWTSLANTLYFSIGIVPGTIVAGLALALLVNRPGRFIRICRTAYFVPVVTSVVVAAVIWETIYDRSFGLLNYLLGRMGLPAVGWLTDPRVAIPSITFVSIWKAAGYYMVIFLAGLQGIPDELYEAARIDGAGRRDLFWRITLPMLRPVMVFVAIILTIRALQIFDWVYVMTDGGPGYATTTTIKYVYDVGFKFYRMGYAAAITFVLFAIIFTLSVLQRRYFSGDVLY